MLPPLNKPTATFAVFPQKDVKVTKENVYHLTASAGGKNVADATIVRLLASPNLAMKKIRQGTLYADLYYPSSFAHDGHKHPAVIVLGGSEGGIVTADFVARWLASRDFVALATAWYHIGTLPKNMVNVPIKPVREALTYLQSMSFVNSKAIGAWGGSWGGTLALFAAAHFRQIHAVVSAVGPVTVGNGINRGVPPADYRSVDASPFLYEGRPVPFVTYKEYQKFLVSRDQSLIEKALIPIWQINGPVLFIAGGDDKLASSGIEASVALNLLKTHHHHFPFRVVYYPNAGHVIFPGYWPTTTWAIASKYIPVGGTPAGYARADAEVGPATINFLHQALSASPPPATHDAHR
jgi:dienelactone hydrolase